MVAPWEFATTMIDFAPNMNQLNQRAYLANRIK